MSNSNIELLNSHPKESLLKLSFPIIISLIIVALYNIIDGIWIAALGQNAIAGVGLTIPLWMIINGFSTGLSNGVTSSITRFRAESDEKSNRVGEQSIILFLVVSVILTVVLLLVLFPFLDIYSINPDSYWQAVEYAVPLFLGLITFVFSIGLAAILRAEGDTKRAMYATSLGIILNAVLDPVFIYYFNMGVSGAAVSTVFTSAITASIIFYWIFIKKDTYIKLNTKNIINFKINWEILKDILNTGIPASIVPLILSSASFLFYYFINILSGSLGVGVFSSGNRIYLLGITPLMGFCYAFVSVVGTHFGKNNMKSIKLAHYYACLYCVIVGLVITVLLIVFSDHFAYLFSLSTNDSIWVNEISVFIKFTALCFPFMAIGLPSSYLYQGLGKGIYSLFFTFFSEIVCTVLAVYLLAFLLDYGLIGVWLGFVVGRGISSIINFILATYTVNKLKKEFRLKKIK